MTQQMTVVLGPGQGAQAVGMGKAWAAASPAAKAIFDQADAVLGDRSRCATRAQSRFWLILIAEIRTFKTVNSYQG